MILNTISQWMHLPNKDSKFCRLCRTFMPWNTHSCHVEISLGNAEFFPQPLIIKVKYFEHKVILVWVCQITQMWYIFDVRFNGDVWHLTKVYKFKWKNLKVKNFLNILKCHSLLSCFNFIEVIHFLSKYVIVAKFNQFYALC